jgi:hypothetical protein
MTCHHIRLILTNFEMSFLPTFVDYLYERKRRYDLARYVGNRLASAAAQSPFAHPAHDGVRCWVHLELGWGGGGECSDSRVSAATHRHTTER